VGIYYMNCFSDDVFLFFDLLLMHRLWLRLSSNSRSIIISCVTLVTYLTSVYFSFLICKRMLIITPTFRVVKRSKGDNAPKCLTEYVAQRLSTDVSC